MKSDIVVQGVALDVARISDPRFDGGAACAGNSQRICELRIVIVGVGSAPFSEKGGVELSVLG